MTIQVPAGWTAPQSSNSSNPGYISVSTGSCSSASLDAITGTGPWTIPVSIICGGGDSFTLTYAGGGTKVTAPSVANYIFTTKTKQNAGTLTNITSQPTVSVVKITPILSVTNSPVIYNGSAHTPTVTGSVPGVVSNVLVDGNATKTTAGTWAVTANFVPTDTTNYNSLTGASAGNFVINKATPNISVTNSPMKYNGSAQSATVTGSTTGTVSNVRYNGSATVPTNVSTYAVIADFTPSNTTNYNSLTGASAGNFDITPADSTTTVSCPASETYTGSEITPCTVSVAGAGGLSLTPTPDYTANTNVGTVNASYTFAGDANHSGSADSKTFNITPATPTATLSVTNSPVTYDGNAHSATVGITTSSVDGSVANILIGSAATQTNANTYAVTADFVPTNPNYNTLIGLPAGDFVINKATPTATLAVNNSPVTYNGAGQAATVEVSASSVRPGTVANVLTGGAATQTDVNTYAVTADFVPNDATNYSTLTGLSAGDFVISKADASIIITPYDVTYDNNPHTASGTATGALGEDLSGSLNLGGTTHTDANTYNGDAWSFVGGANYNDDGGTVDDSIAKADATVTVDGYTGIYDGAPHSASGTAKGIGDVDLSSGLNLGASFTDVPGGTADWTFTGGTNYKDQSGTADIVINKATPTATLAVNNSPVTYNGAGQAATVEVSASSVPGTVANVLTGGAATQTDVNTYAVTADFVPNDATNYSTLTGLSAGDFVINAAPIITHIINTSTPGGHGSISPAGAVVVNDGNDQTFTITPKDGYQISDVLVDGDSVGEVTNYTFTNVTTDHTISATFFTPSVNIIPATGGSAISASDTGGTYTLLTGPVVDELSNKSIKTGTIVLNAPSGFEFDTSSAVTVTVSRLDAGTRDLLTLLSNTAVVTGNTITVTVSAKDQNGGNPKALSELTWAGIKVRPTAITPLASGNITKSGTATFTGDTSNYGTLTEVAGTPAPSTYTVAFNSEGGSAEDSITGITSGSTVTLPSDPTKDGYTFAGWYTGEEGSGTAFTSSTPVTADITVYANWTPNESEISITPPPAPHHYGSTRIFPVGQVLGASTGPIDGCGNRTTGFSITTGKSCVGNTGEGQVLGAEKFIFTQFMKLGLKRSEVPELQTRLTSEGFYKGLIDGIFGKSTDQAVRDYQKANPPLKIDGIVGVKTRAVLNK